MRVIQFGCVSDFKVGWRSRHWHRPLTGLGRGEVRPKKTGRGDRVWIFCNHLYSSVWGVSSGRHVSPNGSFGRTCNCSREKGRVSKLPHCTYEIRSDGGYHFFRCGLSSPLRRPSLDMSRKKESMFFKSPHFK